jgi:phosphinothricin acetyltransferase
MTTGPVIRHARQRDLQGVVEILNHYIKTDPCTFDMEPWGVEDKQAWFDSLSTSGRHQLLVAEDSGTICGYAHSGPFRPKVGYQTTVETTVYVHADAPGRGLGGLLMKSLLASIEGTGVHRAIAIIVQPNEASNRLHQRLGFHPVGTFSEVGYKFEQYWDSTWYERQF